MTPERRALLLRRCAVRSAIFDTHIQPRIEVPESLLRAPLDEHALTSRQTAVIQLVADGSTNGEIATTLAISLETVKEHMARASGRLGTSNRAGSVAVALRSGLID